MCIASLVRDLNADLWAPDLAGEASPEMLRHEPVVADCFESMDGRTWVRIYVDGSALDQFGNVQVNAPRAAAMRRLEMPGLLAA